MEYHIGDKVKVTAYHCNADLGVGTIVSEKIFRYNNKLPYRLVEFKEFTANVRGHNIPRTTLNFYEIELTPAGSDIQEIWPGMTFMRASDNQIITLFKSPDGWYIGGDCGLPYTLKTDRIYTAEEIKEIANKWVDNHGYSIQPRDKK